MPGKLWRDDFCRLKLGNRSTYGSQREGGKRKKALFVHAWLLCNISMRIVGAGKPIKGRGNLEKMIQM